MKKTSRSIYLLFGFLLLIIALTVGVTVYKHYYLADFTSYFQVPCDPAERSCFFMEDTESESCTDDSAACGYTVTFLAVAQHALVCEPDEGTCLEEICANNPTACVTVECSTAYATYLGIADTCTSPQ